MSRGKHLSLEEARKAGRLDRFSKEHPSTGERDEFDRALAAMLKGSGAGGETSEAESSEGSTETQTPPDFSKDA